MSHDALQALVWPKGRGPGLGPLPMSARLQHDLRLAAQFGTFAAGCDDRDALLDEVCRVAAEGLGATFAKLLVYRPDERVFALEAGIGWRDGIVGRAWFDADVGTAAGFAWQSGRSIVSNNILTDGRFRVPNLLLEHGIVRSINVVVPGDDEAPFGVLEVESPETGEFAAHDAHFLQLLAASLAAAIGRGRRQGLHDEQLARHADDHEASLHEMQHRVRNDLQAICSSVAGEARVAADPAQREGFERVGRRVLALAALYDHLLGKQVGRSVDFGAYLSSLCGKIAGAADLASRAIALNADTQPVDMLLDQAVAFAVAVNELVANAAEHAFPDGRLGTIIVRLLANGEDGTGGPTVTVSDDGKGFTGRRAGGAGLGFVERLVRQAGGILIREDGAGTRWHIKLQA